MEPNSSEGKQQIIRELVTQIQDDGSFNYVTKFTLTTYATQLKFNNFVVGISPSDDTVISKNIDAVKAQYLLSNLIDCLVNNSLTVQSFAVTKYYLDSLYLLIFENGRLHFTYQPPYLIRSSELCEQLGVSQATIMQMVSNGMETVANVGDFCYPIHNAFYWKDGLWASRIQSLHQQLKLRNQTKEDLIKEIEKEINHFTTRYNGDFYTVFADVLSGQKAKYDLEEPDDFNDWKSLLDDLAELEGNG
ncbi:hypothetical protein J2S74_004959 [Evansella vedderi]|uniref:DNA-binding protein n=1 Tax=Evansella vedderi TaxID=38282 RepID=A0ABU0A3G6_9BACI|nr:hypothetical protein [Evansella vedderi]MDQ0257501.1 hypothetical protein [Evansella vedderi]